MSNEIELEVGGLTAMTTLDYPGELAAVIFCQGCPWRCRYCHNGDLIPRQGKRVVPWVDIVRFLQRRRGLLDAVVFSGGEPTLQKALPSAIEQVKAMGYRIGLHTGGPYPRRLQALLPALDWVGLDIKAAEEDYAKVTGIEGSGKQAWESARLLIESGIAHAIRTTVHASLTSASELHRIEQRLQAFGATHYQLQRCISEHSLDPALQSEAGSSSLSNSGR